MTLASLQNINFSKNDDAAWFAHFQDHIEIVQTIRKKFGVALTIYPIFPFNENDVDNGLLRHQLYHDDMNSVLGVNSGTDLQSLDIKNPEAVAVWRNLNFNEHYVVRQALGI